MTKLYTRSFCAFIVLLLMSFAFTPVFAGKGPERARAVTGVVTSTGNTAYTAGANPVAVDASLNILYPNNILGASVSIGSFSSGDNLIFVNQNGITGSYQTSTGVLTLSGTAASAAYQAAFRSIRFSSQSTAIGSRSVTFTINTGSSNLSASKTVVVSAPTVSVNSIIRVNPGDTNLGSVQYLVTLSAAVSGLSTANFAATAISGNISGQAVTQVSGSNPYTVTVNTGTGDGALRLDMVNSTNVSPAVSNLTYTSGQFYNIDKTPPVVSSITANIPSNANTVNSHSVIYDVEFSESVTNVDASAFKVTADATLSGSVIQVSGSQNSYSIVVGNISGTGALRLDLNSGTSITDAAGNTVSGGYTGGDTYTILTAPNQTATNVYAGVQETSANVYWTKGNGATRAVFMAPATSGYLSLKDSTTYSAGTSFGSGTQAGTSGWYCVYNGNDSYSYSPNFNGYVSVNNLLANTAYKVAVIEYNGSGSSSTYGFAIPGNSTSFTTAAYPSLTASTGTITYLPTTSPVVIDSGITASAGRHIIQSVISITGNFASGDQLSYTPLSGMYGSYNAATGVFTVNSDKAVSDIITALRTFTFSTTSTSTATRTISFTIADSSATSSAVTKDIIIPSNDATLASLSLSDGSLSPSFDAETTVYTANVANSTTGITVTPTVNYSSATVTVNGNPASTPVILNVGDNNITVEVTAQDGSTKTDYMVTVTRAASADALLSGLVLSSGTLDPVFDPATTSYTAGVANSVSSITLTPLTHDGNATVTVNGKTPATSVSLTAGSATTIPVIVTAPDGSTTNTYTIAVTRDASTVATLSNVSVSSGTLSPAFSSTTASYAVAVSNTTTSITVTPTTTDNTATVTVNGQPATTSVPLNVGVNIITTQITAMDGKTMQSYTITVTRAASANAYLSALTFSGGPLNPVFNRVTTSYAVNSPRIAVYVRATAEDGGSTITVNGIAATSGQLSGVIQLNVSATTPIKVKVVAADGKTTRTYTLNATLTGSSNTLATLTVNPSSTLVNTNTTATETDYSTSVAVGITAVSLNVNLDDAKGSITVNGTKLANNTASPTIPLNSDGSPTLITSQVTSQNGVVMNYVVTVNKTGSSNVKSVTVFYPNISFKFSGSVGQDYYFIANGVEATSVLVNTTVDDLTSTITVDGIPVRNKTNSKSIKLDLANGKATTIAIQITSANGTIRTNFFQFYGKPALNNLNAVFAEVPEYSNIPVKVNPALSPDGDGINDVLHIDGIETRPDNKLTIVNRSGGKVFEVKGYDNQFKVFDGHSSFNHSLQPAGTYFYVLEYKDNGETKSKTGYVILRY